ncbi:cellulose biosynthesis protein BcsS [Acidithiobacillus sp. AMEEHan]|uniref:cellulose biosynthesis protein BcsS n=1 Tax=Acidithiobacillus sp. AMEEHan TaxID=2994951 RepID=UPI0027E3C032|nr:cellulose biosynthesis protein BcsS [Acidithiobacillus sp. AMEEHan]
MRFPHPTILSYGFRSFVLTVLLFGIFAKPAMGENFALVGVQQSAQSSYDYLGWIQPFVGSALGRGLYGQIFLNYLTFHYSSSVGDAPVLVQARVPGVSLGLGYAFSVGVLQVNISGSFGYQYFSLQPAIPAGGPYRSSFTFVPQVQLHLPLSHGFYLSGIGSYAFGQDSYWSRLRFGIPLGARWHCGPEFIPSGGRNYQIRQYGAYVDVSLSQGWGLTLDGGMQQQDGLANVGYAALSLSKTF